MPVPSERERPRREETDLRAYNLAIDAGIQAGKATLRYWPHIENPDFDKTVADNALRIVQTKAGSSNYATLADRESEALIRDRIREQREVGDPIGYYGIKGEELEQTEGNPEGIWIIDPIDGTMRFRGGSQEWGISIGLIRGQKPIVGSIALPARQRIIAARAGHGAKLLSFDRKEVADLTSLQIPSVPLDKALIGADYGYEGRGRQLKQYTAQLADDVGYPISYGSCSYLNALLALGEIQGYFCEGPTIFDVAGAAAIIPEVGGVVTTMKGDPIDWQGWDKRPQSYLATRDPRLHEQLLRKLN